MAKFRVAGADRETGEEVELLVEADTAEVAQAKANRRGIVVAECAVAQPSPSSQRVGQARPRTHSAGGSSSATAPPSSAASSQPPSTSTPSQSVTSPKRAKLPFRLMGAGVLMAVVIGYVANIYFRVPKYADVKDGGPSYRGKTAAEWVKVTQDKDEVTRREALIALAAIGPEMGQKNWAGIADQYFDLAVRFRGAAGVSSDDAQILVALSRCQWNLSGLPIASTPQEVRERHEHVATLLGDMAGVTDPKVRQDVASVLEEKASGIIADVDATNRDLISHSLFASARAYREDDPEGSDRLMKLAERIKSAKK